MGPGMEVLASIACATVTGKWLEKVAPLADSTKRQTVLINVGVRDHAHAGATLTP